MSGCADDLEAEPETTTSELRVSTSPSDQGDFVTRVDASNAESWVYFSFDSQAEVVPASPADSTEWDLAFQRFHILSNGGASGSGGAEVSIVSDQTFAELTSPPADGYMADQPDSDDDDTVNDSAFAFDGGWYDYDPATNRLSPKPLVYVVRTSSGAHYKLEILDYYDEAGTSGHPMFAWARL